MTSSRDHLSRADNFRLAAIQTGSRGLIDRLNAVMRNGQAKYTRNPQPSLAAQFCSQHDHLAETLGFWTFNPNLRRNPERSIWCTQIMQEEAVEIWKKYKNKPRVPY